MFCVKKKVAHPLIPNIISYSNIFIEGDGDDEEADKDNVVAPGGESSTNLITSISLTWMIRTTAITIVIRISIFVGQKLSSIAKNPLSGFSVASMCL